MTATGTYMDGTNLTDSAAIGAGFDAAMVEMRFQFDGYEGAAGRIEGRDDAGSRLFALDLRQVGEAAVNKRYRASFDQRIERILSRDRG